MDSMGFEAFYVNTPRPHDAGMLIVGDPLVAVRRSTAMCVWTYVRVRHVHTYMRVGRDGGSCSARVRCDLWRPHMCDAALPAPRVNSSAVR